STLRIPGGAPRGPRVRGAAGRQAECMAKTEKRRKPGRLPRQVTKAIAAAEDKKALDVVLLDLRAAAGFADHFLICSGGNARQIRAIADGIMEALAEDGAKPAHVEGYGRERLWGNAEKVELPASV